MNKTVKNIIWFVVAAAVFCGLGLFLKTATAERFSFTMSLSKPETVVVGDMGKQGFLKKVFQPGVLDYTSGHRGGVVNDTGADLNLQIEVDSPYKVKLVSGAGGFDAENNIFRRPIKADAQITLEAIVSIPRSELKDAVGKEIVLHLKDSKTGEQVSDLVLVVANEEK